LLCPPALHLTAPACWPKRTLGGTTSLIDSTAPARARGAIAQLRNALKKTRSAALKQRKNTSATATTKATRSLTKAANRLQKKVKSVTKRVGTPKLRNESEAIHWTGARPGGATRWLASMDWTREAVLAEAKKGDYYRLLEVYGYGDDDWVILWER
jgi:hypothetical protein